MADTWPGELIFVFQEWKTEIWFQALVFPPLWASPVACLCLPFLALRRLVRSLLLGLLKPEWNTQNQMLTYCRSGAECLSPPTTKLGSLSAFMWDHLVESAPEESEQNMIDSSSCSTIKYQKLYYYYLQGMDVHCSVSFHFLVTHRIPWMAAPPRFLSLNEV